MPKCLRWQSNFEIIPLGIKKQICKHEIRKRTKASLDLGSARRDSMHVGPFSNENPPPSEVMFKDIKQREFVIESEFGGENTEWYGGSRFERKKFRSPLRTRNQQPPPLATMVSLA